MPIYFIADKAQTAIKIGRTKDLLDRFANLRGSCPVPLVFVGYNPTDERRAEGLVHKRFAHLRMHSEWFRYSAEIISAIERPARIVARSEWSWGRHVFRYRLIERVSAEPADAAAPSAPEAA